MSNARFFLFAPVALALSACGQKPAAEKEPDTEPTADLPLGHYDVDAETGEVSASYTDPGGTVTTMRSGEKVPVKLPAGFKVYPGAKVVNNTRVEQADGTIVLLNFISEDEPAKLISHYRKLAEEAGIDPNLELTSGPMSMIGGEGKDGTSFSLTTTRQGSLTEAQLSIGQGIK